MHTICTLSLKGGAGKSTVVQSLAVCAVQHGQKTLIVELDPQGSLKNWSKRREAEEPRVLQTLPQSLSDVLQEAERDGTNWVFIDTPGHDTSTAAAAAVHADLILIPCKIQSMKDFDSVMLTLAEANRSGKPAYVLMNQVPPNSPKLIRRKQVEIQREYDIAVLSKCLSRRADFEYCDARGLSAAEFNPKGAAADEILRLYSLLQSIFITLGSSGSHRPLADLEPAHAIPRDVELELESELDTSTESRQKSGEESTSEDKQELADELAEELADELAEEIDAREALERLEAELDEAEVDEVKVNEAEMDEVKEATNLRPFAPRNWYR